MKKRVYCLLGIIFLCVGCADDSLQYIGDSQGTSEIEEHKELSETMDYYDTITVHICGEVYFPGVYTVYSDSRVHEVVKMAGGFTELADTVAVNQAKEVSDGQQIYIPSILEKEDNVSGQGTVDINRASQEQLCTIPGIGVSRAKQIIEYREKNGFFEKIEDIMKISGIKEGMFEKIAPYITVS